MESKNYRKYIETRLIAKALKDESFHNDLCSAPKTTIQKELGMNIPDEINIHLIKDNENEVCLVLPHNFCDTNELTGMELESVDGGGYIYTGNSCMTACIG